MREEVISSGGTIDPTPAASTAGPSSPAVPTNVGSIDLSIHGYGSKTASLSCDEHSQQPRTSLSTSAGGSALGSSRPSCRPWGRGDLLRRLATFKPSYWFGKPKVASSLACAQRGWTNANVDKIACESCGAYLSFVLLPSWSTNEVERAGEAFAMQLDAGHSVTCPWRGNSYPESLVQFLPTPHSALIGGYKDRCDGLLQFRSLPVVAGSAVEQMRISRGQQVQHSLSQSSTFMDGDVDHKADSIPELETTNEGKLLPNIEVDLNLTLAGGLSYNQLDRAAVSENIHNAYMGRDLMIGQPSGSELGDHAASYESQGPSSRKRTLEIGGSSNARPQLMMQHADSFEGTVIDLDGDEVTDGGRYLAGPSKRVRDSDMFDTYCSSYQRESSEASPSRSLGFETCADANISSSFRQGSGQFLGIPSTPDSTRASSVIAMDTICHNPYLTTGKGTSQQQLTKGKGVARQPIPDDDPILEQLKRIDPGLNEPWVPEAKRADGTPILRRESIMDDPEAQMAVVRAFLTPYDDLATEVADPKAVISQSLTVAAQQMISTISLNKLLMKAEQELRVAGRKKKETQQVVEDLKKELGKERDNSRYHHDQSLRTLQELKKLQEDALEHDRVLREKDESYTKVWGERVILAGQVEELTKRLEQKEEAREAAQHQKDKFQRLFSHFTDQVNVIGCTLYREAWNCRSGPKKQWFTPDQMDMKIGYQPGVYPVSQFVDSDEEIGDESVPVPVAVDKTIGAAATEAPVAEVTLGQADVDEVTRDNVLLTGLDLTQLETAPS